MFRLILIATALLAVGLTSLQSADAPPIGWTTAATVTRIIDGDTIEVEIRRTVRVRLLDCWAPESRTTDTAEKVRGLAAKEHLTDLCDAKRVTLHVPAERSGDVSKLWTMGRILGQVWLVDDPLSLSEHQVRAGHATTTKDGPPALRIPEGGRL